MRANAAVLLVGAIAVLGVLFWVGGADPGAAQVPARADTEGLAPVDLQAPPSIERDLARTVRVADPDRTDVTGVPFSVDEDPAHEPAAVGRSVLVLDASGNPVAGVPVLAIKPRQTEFLAISVGSAVTGDDGVATFSPGSPSEGPVRALLGFPHFPPIDVALPTAATDSRATLRMPPTGSLLVRVLDEQGTPFVGAGPVMAGLAGLVVTGRSDGFQVPSDRGVALFPRVGLGLLMDLQVRLDEFDDWMARSGVVGPAAAGEQVEAVFRGVEQPVITGILLDRTGDVLANATVRITTHVEQNSGSSSRGGDARTDEMGRFRVLLRESWRSGATRGIRLSDGAGSSGRYVAVDLSRELSGVVDLGVLVMTGASLICAGRVVDAWQPLSTEWSWNSRRRRSAPGRTAGHESWRPAAVSRKR